MEPFILERLCRDSGVLVVALHEAQTLDTELADSALLYLAAALVHDLGRLAVAGHADSTHMVDVPEPQMHTS